MLVLRNSSSLMHQQEHSTRRSLALSSRTSSMSPSFHVLQPFCRPQLSKCAIPPQQQQPVQPSQQTQVPLQQHNEFHCEKEDESEHRSNQISFLLLASLLLLSLPYTSTHPQALLILPVALVLPGTGDALRPLVSDASVAVFNMLKWLAQNGKEHPDQHRAHAHAHPVVHQQVPLPQQPLHQHPQPHVAPAHIHLNPHPHPQPIVTAQHPAGVDAQRHASFVQPAMPSAAPSQAHPAILPGSLPLQHVHAGPVVDSLDLDLERERERVHKHASAHVGHHHGLNEHHVLDARVLSNAESCAPGSSSSGAAHAQDAGVAHFGQTQPTQHVHLRYPAHDPAADARPAAPQHLHNVAAHAKDHGSRHVALGSEVAADRQPWLDPLLSVAPWMRSWGGFL